MVNLVLPALLNLVFAGAILLLINSFGVKEYSDMYAASVSRFLTSPWSESPTRTIKEVKGPKQVYSWLNNVFATQLYSEAFVNGDEHDYCTKSFPCVLGEGNAVTKDQCQTGLVVGADGCPSYIEETASCCEPCTEDCADVTISTRTYDITNTTRVTDLSENCMDELPAWLDHLTEWDRDGGPDPPPDPLPPFIFCPERMSTVDTDVATFKAEMVERPLMVARYNRVIMGRLTLKRMQIVPHKSLAFKHGYSYQFKTSHLFYDNYNLISENTTDFGTSESSVYQNNGGYRGRGGFVKYLDFEKGEMALRSTFAELQAEGWFDLAQATLTLDLIFYNGNVNKFLHVTFAFQHTAAGQTSFFVHAVPLDLSLHDFGRARTYTRIVTYFILACLFIFFLKDEITDMTAAPTEYFTNYLKVISLSALLMFFVTLIVYCQLVLTHEYITLEFPLPDQDFEQHKRIEEYDQLVYLGYMQDLFFSCLSFLWLLFMWRVIVIGTSLVPDMSIVFATLRSILPNLFAWFALLVVFWAGFTISYHYIFGVRSYQFSEPYLASLTTLRMMCGQTMFEDMQQGDPNYATLLFIGFHLWFLIIFQMMYSIVILGYGLEKKDAENSGDGVEKQPFHKICANLKEFVKGHLSPLTRLLSILDQLVGSSDAGTGRINADEIAKLRDKRQEKPRLRTVRYEQKHAIKIEKDILLREEPPAYRTGRMHYIVDYMEPEGQAESHNVRKGFRLIGYKAAALALDCSKFREPETFDKAYNKSTKKMLQIIGENLKEDDNFGPAPSIDLLFEGDSKKVTFNCASFLVFWALFVIWATFVCRVLTSYELNAIQANSLRGPAWYEYNRMRVVDYDRITRMSSVPLWLRNAVIEKNFECYGSIYNTSEACADHLDDMVRPDWVLFANQIQVSSPLYLEYDGGIEGAAGEDATIPAHGGYSIGYVPGEDTVTVTEAQRVADYNIGVHYNSHLRLTLQLPCFEKNTRDRWEAGYPYVLSSAIAKKNCMFHGCMQEAILEAEATNSPCLNRYGEERPQLRYFDGSWSKMTYRYTEESSFAGRGGIVAGFGNTKQEARIILTALTEDNLFAEATSVAMEIVTYNGNYKLFTYTTAKFAVDETGLLEKHLDTITYPLELFTQGSLEGSSAGQRLAFVFAVFGIILLYMLFFIWRMMVDIYVQYKISSKMYHHIFQMPFDYIVEDAWNVVEIASLCLTAGVICQLFIYQSYKPDIKLKPPWFVESWTIDYKPSGVAERDQPPDTFDDHAYVGQSWRLLVALIALASMSLALNALKYMNFAASLRLSMMTFGSAAAELLSMTIIICLMLYGFVVMFNLRFGVQFHRFGTPTESLSELFIWICGDFHIDDLVRSVPAYVLCIFPFFVILFILLTTMFLAAVVYKWETTRMDARDPSVVNELYRVYDFLFPKKLEDTGDSAREATQMDGKYWMGCSILQQLPKLQEDGRIIEVRHHGDSAAEAQRAEHSRTAKRIEADGYGHNGQASLRKPELSTKNIELVFRRVHMEIASQLCRKVYVEEEDEDDYGGGVGELDEHALEEDRPPRAGDTGSAGQGMVAEDEKALEGTITLPILDHEVKDDIKTDVQNKLQSQLNVDRNRDAQEFLLDALVTALEKTPVLAEVRDFFRLPPILYPKKPEEKKNFEESKQNMEIRLNHVLRWLEAESKLKHYALLKDQALARERVLKQQSLVLADYLEGLENSIEDLRKEIAELNSSTQNLRKHVTPLL